MSVGDPFNPQPPVMGTLASICRCATSHEHISRAAEQVAYSANLKTELARKQADAIVAEKDKRLAELLANRPDPDKYEVEDVVEVGPHLVMKVKYPSCSACAYEGNKVMVFLDVKVIEVLKWKRVDPHFRGPGHQTKTPAGTREAPSPAARFPASVDGWTDALAYARVQAGRVTK